MSAIHYLIGRHNHGKSMFIQYGCWEDLRSPYTGAKPQPITKILHPWVQDFCPVLGLKSGW